MLEMDIAEKFRIFGNFRAKVLDNDDPLQQGRIKAEIYPFYKGVSEDKLPWAVPAGSLFEGAIGAYGSFSIPKVDSYVFVFFEGGDHHQPVYFASALTATAGIPAESATNYPNTKVWKTAAGITMIVDDDAGLIQVTHPTGITVSITSSGITMLGLSGAQLGIDAAGNVNITGTTVNINP